MPDSCLRLVALVGLALLAAPTAADDTGLRGCASIADDAMRLACYDKLAAYAVGEDKSAAPAVPTVGEDKGTAPTEPGNDTLERITDDFGAEQLEQSDANFREAQPVRVTVVSCTKDRVGKYYFTLDNGQVWQQRDSDRLRYKECAFDASIVRDGFGYKMTIDGRKGRVRVGRVR